MNHKEKAIALFKHGHNCSQAVICAYTEAYNIDDETAYRLAEGFGGGFGGSRLTCGAVSGMVMVASLHTCPKKDVDHPTKKATYPTVQKMMEAFKERNTYLDCGDLLKHKDSTLIDGKKAGCLKCVGDCCDIIEEYLND